jgi:ferredoxin-NADP reductase
VEHDQVLRTHGYHPLKVARVVQETDDTRSYVLDVPAEYADLFAYEPGQFCVFRVHVDGEELARCYSMSSAPAIDAQLTVTVKRVPGGKVSNWLQDNVREGDSLDVMKPGGTFVPHAGERPVVGFCGGSGVTPVFSIAKWVLATTERPVRMLYANRNAESVIFAAELQQLQATYGDRFELVSHLDSDGGYLTPEAVAGFVGTDLEADYYICGPGPFMDLAENTLHAAGVDPARISIERFVMAHEQGEETVVEPDSVTEQVTLVVRRRKSTHAYRPGDTILATARRGAVQTPFSCEAGVCASCMALVTDGVVHMRVNSALTPEEVAEGWVLTCQALPVSRTVTIEFEGL